MISIPFYGLFIIIGILVAILAMQLIFKLILKTKLNYHYLFQFVVYIYLFAFCGGKLFYLIFDYNWHEPITTDIIKYGFSIFGAAFGGMIFFLLIHNNQYKKIFFDINNKGLKILQVIILVVIPIVNFFGRIGCYVTGCCGGKLIILSQSIPIQFISALFYLQCLIFNIIILYFFKKNFSTKKINQSVSTIFFMCTYIITIATERIVLDKYRHDTIQGAYFGFSKYQLLAIVFLSILTILMSLIYLLQHKGNTSE